MHWYQIGFLITFIPLIAISLVFPFIREWRFQVKYDDGLKEWIPIDIVAEMAKIKFTG